MNLNTKYPDEKSKLDRLAMQIRALLKENDVAGMINLQGKDQAHHIMDVSPSWGCLTIEEGVGPDEGHKQVRFQAQMATGPEEEKERARLTVGMVMGMLHILEVHQENMSNLMNVLSQHFDIECVMRNDPIPSRQ